MSRGSGGGPRTPAGKTRSAQNARRHGLNSPLANDAGVQTRLRALAAAFGGDLGADGARAAAEARLHMEQVCAAKLGALELSLRAPTALAGQDPAAAALLRSLPEIAKLDVYERKARSRLKRILRVK